MDLIDRQAAIGAIRTLYPGMPFIPRNREEWRKEYWQYMEAERALEQLPAAQPDVPDTNDGDMIFRKAAIDALCEEPLVWSGKDEYGQGLNNQWHYDVNALRAVPSAQGWIPCSERLPDDLAEVNITWVNHNPEPYYEFVKDKPATATAVYYKGKWYWWSAVVQDYLAEYGEWDCDKMDDAIEVTHWMPLPEPPKEET